MWLLVWLLIIPKYTIFLFYNWPYSIVWTSQGMITGVKTTQPLATDHWVKQWTSAGKFWWAPHWVFCYDYFPYGSMWNEGSNCRPRIPILVKVTCERHSSPTQPALHSRHPYAHVFSVKIPPADKIYKCSISENAALNWWLTLEVQLWHVAYSVEV